MQLIPTILCGGAGARLWPVSRELHPKPFIRLIDGQSLLQKTFLRGSSIHNVTDMLIVTNRDLFFKVEDDCQSVNSSELSLSFILEPFGRNTAPAIAAASLYVANQYGEESLLLVMPADHLISDNAAFIIGVREAEKMAREEKIVTFGIKPDSPETGYGYIETSGQDVCNFIEKPSLEKAKEYIQAGNFLWNAGIFCFSAKVMLEEMECLCPELLFAVKSCVEQSGIRIGKNLSQLELDPSAFGEVPEESIDYAIIEKSERIAVVPCNMGWSDIGSWSALNDLVSPDAQGNRVEGEAFLHDVSNCYIQSRERLIGAIGVDNLVIIDTPDALLVADKNRSQEVKHLYTRLKAEGHETHKLHRTVYRPWGTYTILEEGTQFKIKRIEVKPGASLSLQMHHHRSEHWIVVSGMAKVINGERETLITTNQSTYIPAGNKHRLENPGLLPLVLIEVQSGEYLGEDDIVRFEDNYERLNN